MIRNASLDDLPALRALFARANDAPYDLEAVAEEKCFGHGMSGAPVVRAFEGMKGVAVTCGRYVRILAVDPSERRKGIGSALLEDAMARGARVIAAEPGNYFTPGVVDTDTTTIAFLQNRRFEEKRRTYNLEVSLRVVESSSRRVERPGRGDAPRVLDFIEREFGRIWRFEAARAFETELPRIFIAEENDGIVGFAAHDVNNRGLGTFGPTGVAKSMRGRGIGCRLLRASLADLHRLGYERAIIPWTDALDFYRKCAGAEPAHRFLEFHL